MEEIPFEVNRWGSCQYSGALWYFDNFRELRKEHSLVETLSELDSDAQWDYVSEFSYIKERFVNYLILCRNELGEEDQDWIDDYNRDIEAAKKLEGPYVDEFFDMLRNHAWDLWSAAPLMANMSFCNLNIQAPGAPGIGPPGNVAAQSVNFQTGLCCALLVEFGLVKDPDEAFGGFDT